MLGKFPAFTFLCVTTKEKKKPRKGFTSFFSPSLEACSKTHASASSLKEKIK
jgi:hypothetical protein